MIYLDNSATTLKKPDCVKEAVWDAMEQMGNSGRGGYQTALSASRMIYQARMAVSEFFDLNHPSGVAFTSNATEALNTVIQGLFSKGDHVITTVLEHNSVLRPLYMEQERGVELSIIGADEQADVLYEKLESAIKCNTKAVICTHGSNVTGNLVDIKRIGAVCRAHQLLFIVDASQSAGCIPISMKENQIDILCFTGHKGLMGPQGIGGICIRKGVKIHPLKTGGTGILSFSKTQPEALPQALEAGTLNGIGIAGLGAAIDHINTYGINKIRKQEKNLIETFYKKMKEIKGIKTYHENPLDFTKQTAICSINLEEYDSGSVSDELMERFHIQTRSGAHCAPLVHEHFGTVEQGMVRFSFGHETTIEEINQIIHAVKILAEE